MSTITQSERQLKLKTPLGEDVLLLETFRTTERISQLFQLEMDVLAEGTTNINFADILTQPIVVSVENADNSLRYFHGIVSRISQGAQLAGSYSGTMLVQYRLQVVPKFWLLSRGFRSQIFQQKTVPDILKLIFTGLDVKFELQGKYESRDYCTQYRESDFHFASRLMEEEGIYYFFKHSVDKHLMIVADTPQSHPVTAPETIDYEPMTGGNRPANRIHTWEKIQEIRAGKSTLWDHCFELPNQNLEASVNVQDSVAVGSINHSLKIGNAAGLEIYDYPGRYAQRFDGIDPGGGDRASDVQKIFQDNKRTAALRMQEEAVNTIAIQGASGCVQLCAGHKFTLNNHFSGNGNYVLTGVHHYGTQAGTFGTGSNQTEYSNTFEAIPTGLPFRPQSVTPKARILGTQTATVVGPSDEEIFTDKYGRVKAQFHWDRDGKKDADSSCWVRVATLWAGTQWGMIHIPRIGQEVVVAFEEGDPDRPIIVGSVYNAAMMPPYELPDNRTQSGVKSRSSLKGTEAHFNEIRFEDKKGSEEIYVHAEKDFIRVVENNDTLKVGHSTKKQGDQTIEIFNNQSIAIGAGKGEAMDGSQKSTIWKNRTTTIEIGDDKLTVSKGHSTTKVAESITIVTGDSKVVLKKDGTISISGKDITITGSNSVMLKSGESHLKLTPAVATITGLKSTFEGKTSAQLIGAMVKVQATGICTISGAMTKIG